MNNNHLQNNVKYKLVDVVEMGYSIHDKPYPRGEICVQTPTMFSGYYNDKELTNSVLKDGWIHTGDIGEDRGNGNIVIIDRKKHIFKLAQGEFVAPEKIETILLQCKYIQQIFVYGDSLQSFIVAVVVPNNDLLCKWAQDNNIKESFQELVKNPKVAKMLISEFNQIGRDANLQPYEIPQGILVETEPFTPENGLLTSLSKIKRYACEKKYKSQLVELYKQIEIENTKSITQELQDLMNQVLGEEKGTDVAKMGIDSLSAVRLVSAIKEKYHISLEASSVYKKSIHGIAQIIITQDKAKKKIDWNKEIELDETIIPSKLRNDNKKTVLLTGGTGFLGGFLLRDLIEMQFKVYCHVRAKTTNEGLDRIKQNLKKLKIWKEDYEKFIVAIPGDLSSPMLGISKSDIETISSNVNYIYHCGATVNALLPYEQLKSTNVGSTIEVLKLAGMGKQKLVCYISTIGVVQGFQHVVKDDQELSKACLDYFSGYAQSKWVSEQILNIAKKRGFQVIVFRPGMM